LFLFLEKFYEKEKGLTYFVFDLVEAFHLIFFPGQTLVVVEFFLANWGVYYISAITKTFSPTSFSPSP